MQIVPPRYLVPSGRHPIVEALAPDVKSWFADTIVEPIPEELAEILQRMDPCAPKDVLNRRGDRVTSMFRGILSLPQE